jgi:glutamate-1-semialdehyde 2,1-aminomutase
MTDAGQLAYLKDAEEEFRKRTPRSWELFERAAKALPGGVASDGKFRDPYPLYIDRANGVRLVDADRNEYTDYRLSAGAILLGHAPPVVAAAIGEQAQRQINTMLGSEVEIDVAERLTRFVPAMDEVRFANSATEASMFAIRTARSFTDRDVIAKFEGHYLGQHDAILFSGFRKFAGDPARPVPVVESPGVAANASESIVVLPTNMPEETLAIIDEVGDRLAGVIYEPVKETWFGGPQPGFLDALIEKCHQVGALVIFDEAVSGLRWALGGAQTVWGVTPDLAIGGKALASGLAVGSWGGRRDIMEEVVRPSQRLMEVGPLEQERKIYASGTFTGNSVTMAAAAATLGQLEEPGFYDRIDELGEELRVGMRARIEKFGMPMHITGRGSIINIHFSPGPLRGMRDTAKTNVTLMQCYEQACLNRGFYVVTQQSFIGAPHTSEDVERLLDCTDDVFGELTKIV